MMWNCSLFVTNEVTDEVLINKLLLNKVESLDHLSTVLACIIILFHQIQLYLQGSLFMNCKRKPHQHQIIKLHSSYMVIWGQKMELASMLAVADYSLNRCSTATYLFEELSGRVMGFSQLCRMCACCEDVRRTHYVVAIS